MSTSRHLTFHDRRPPHEVQAMLERSMMLLLRPAPTTPPLIYHARGAVNGTPFTIELRLLSADRTTNHYHLTFTAAESDLSATPAPTDTPTLPRTTGSTRKPLDGWIDFWCRDFKVVDAPPAGTQSPEATSDERRATRKDQAAKDAHDRPDPSGLIAHHSSLVATPRTLALIHSSLTFESHLTDVAAIQREITTAMARGSRFITSCKEGDTRLTFQHGHYRRVDEGDEPATETFPDEATFLTFLRRFYQWEVTRGSPRNVTLSEEDAWKLILRLMLPPRG